MLKISNIELTNFMRISHAKLDFSQDNIILITGENGEGKSALLEAIAICMCEHKRGSSFKDYVKVGNDNAHIELSAAIKGQGEIVFDVFLNERGGTPYERVITWGGREYRNSECNEALQNLNLIFYSDIIFAMQQESDIVRLTPAQRAKFMQQIFNFDFEDKINEIKAEADTNSNLLQLTKGKLDVLSKVKDRPILDYRERPFSEEDFEERKKVLADLQNELAKITEYNNEAKAKQQEKHSLEQKLAGLKAQHELIVAQMQTYTNIISTKKPSKSLEEWDKLIKEETDLWRRKEEEHEALADKQVELNNQIQKASDKVKEAQFHIKSIEDKMKQVDSGKCPICGKDFTEHDKSDLAAELEKFYNAKTEAANEVSLLSKKIDEVSEQIQRINGEMNDFQRKVIDYKTKRATDEHIIGDVNFAYEERGKTGDTLQQNEKDINALTVLIDAHEDVEFKDASAIAAKITKIQSGINIYNSVVDYNSQLAATEKQWEMEEAQRAANLEVEKEKYNALSKKNKNLEEVIDLIGTKLPSYIIVKRCSEISNEMNSLIHACFPNIEVGISQSKRGVDLIYRPDKGKNIEKSSLMASGFQKELISLAFRLALCKIYNLSFSFFDEIDSQSSEANSEIVYQYILSLNLFEQIFIISQRKSTIDFIYNNYDVAVYKAENHTYTKLR